MIRTYSNLGGRFHLSATDLGKLDEAVWVDLLRPEKDEEVAVERALRIDVPTIDEMQEIELSSRLYAEDGAHFMTAMMLSQTDTDNVKLSPVSFILHGDRLVTVRYTEPRVFDLFVGRCQKGGLYTADSLMVGLVEGLIERVGDLLERVGHELDALSASIFEVSPPPAAAGRFALPLAKPVKPRDFKEVLVEVSRKGDLLSKVRESLISLQRLMAYAGSAAIVRKPAEETASRIETLARDAQSLADHTAFLTQKINFLLDATLGMINIAQTNIIKLFSVAAVVFLPPTLIASIYGMNFDLMPELREPWGYPAALVAMLLSAILPYQFFKWRGWL